VILWLETINDSEIGANNLKFANLGRFLCKLGVTKGECSKQINHTTPNFDELFQGKKINLSYFFIVTPDLHRKHPKLAMVTLFAPISLSFIISSHHITTEFYLIFHERKFLHNLISKGTLFDP
jgi:hypothetical protein